MSARPPRDPRDPPRRLIDDPAAYAEHEVRLAREAAEAAAKRVREIKQKAGVKG